MLSALRIESFAIIDALEIRFGGGLNVLTGETGAGIGYSVSRRLELR